MNYNQRQFFIFQTHIRSKSWLKSSHKQLESLKTLYVEQIAKNYYK